MPKLPYEVTILLITRTKRNHPVIVIECPCCGDGDIYFSDSDEFDCGTCGNCGKDWKLEVNLYECENNADDNSR